MADGDIILTKRRFRHVKMLDAIVAVNTGVWFDCFGYDQLSIEISGITTATLIVNASNAETKPATGTHHQVRTTITADGEVTYTTLPRWIKIRCSVWTAGTISAFGIFRRTGGGE